MLFIVVGLAIYFLIHKKYKKAVIIIVSFVIFAVLMYFGLPFFIGKKYISVNSYFSIRQSGFLLFCKL